MRLAASSGGERIVLADSYAGAAAMMKPRAVKRRMRPVTEAVRRKSGGLSAATEALAESRDRSGRLSVA